METGTALPGGSAGDQVTWMSMRTTPLRGLFLAAVMLLAPLAGLAPAAATHSAQHTDLQGDWPPHETGNLTFMALDETPLDTDGKGIGSVPRLHGPGAVVMLNVTDKDLVEDSVLVRVTSTSDDVGEEILLHRIEGKQYAVYHGFLGFETTPIEDNGEVYVQEGDTVSAVYIDDEDLMDQVAVSQDVLRWFMAGAGSIVLDNTQYRGTAATAEVTVQDPDIPATDGSFDVRVTSDADPDGFLLSIPQMSEGQYRGHFGFGATTDVTASPPQIAVEDGDKVRVEYAEPGFNARGHEEEPSDEAVWVESFTGILQFTTEDYNTLISGPGACPPAGPCPVPEAFGQSAGTTAALANAWIRLEDQDLAGIGNVTVNVRSTHPTRPAEVDPTGIFVKMDETGTGTGEFLGFLGFISGDPSTGNRLRVVGGAQVEAIYEDADDALGEVQEVATTLTWRHTHDAVLQFRASGTSPLETTYDASYVNTSCGGAGCHPTVGHLTLRDLDLAGSGSVSVRLTSSRDPLGVDVTLTEVGSSGEFRGEFRFNATNSFPEGAGPAENGGFAAIWALHGDHLNAEFHEARGVDGRPRLVSNTAANGASDNIEVTTTPVGQNAVTDTVTKNFRIAASATGSAASAPFVGDQDAFLVLRDPNLASASTTVYVGAADAKPMWDAGGTALGAGPGLAVVLSNFTVGGAFEYRGSFEPQALGLGDGDRFCAYYLHHNETGRRANVWQANSACAIWNAAVPAVDASITFRTAGHLGSDMGIGMPDADTYHGLRTAYVFLQDEDAFADVSKKADEVEVRVVSLADQTGIRIKLRERYGDSGIAPAGVLFPSDVGFVGSFSLTKGASVPGKSLKVADGNTISAFYIDPRNDDGEQETFVAYVRWEETSSGKLTIDRSLYRHTVPSGTTVQVTVEDDDQDTSAGQDAIAAGDMRLEARNPRNGDVVFFTATETTGGSGIFRGQFLFEREDNLAGTPAADRLMVRDGDEFEVYYHEANDTFGKAVEHRRTATWLDVTATHLTLDRKTYTTYDAVAGITLVDKDQDVTALKDEFYVVVTSDRDGGGERILVRETTGTSGEFVGSFGFEGARVLGNGRLAVQDGDRISVHFIDKEQDGDALLDEKAAKRADAVWEATANSPPDLEVTTTPALDGTTVRIDPGQTVSFSLSATDKDGTIVSWSVDFGDETDMINNSGVPLADPIAHTYGVSGTYTVNFTATDDDGAVGRLSLTVLVRTTDQDPPGAVTDLRVVETNIGRVVLAWKVPKNNETGTGTAGPDGYTIRRSATAIADEEAFDAATPVPLGSMTFSPAVRTQTAGSEQQVTISGLERSTVYFFAVRATDLGGNEGAFAFVRATTLAADNTAPRGVPVVTSSHPEGEPTDDADLTVFWTTVEELDTPASLRYYLVLNEQDAYTVNCISEEATTGTSWSRYGVDDGTYYFHLAAGSDGGCGPTVTYGPIIVAVEGGPVDEGPTDLEIRNANAAVNVSVVRREGGNLVTWSLPQDQPAVVAGVQIWRSESPYTLVVDLDADSEGFASGQYLDEGASVDALYLVTLYYVGGFGKASDEAGTGIPGFSEMQGHAVQTAEPQERGFFQKLIDDYWLWLLIGLGALVLVLVTVLAVLMRPRTKSEGEGAWDEASDDASGEGMAWPEAETAELENDDGWPALDEDEYAVEDDDAPAESESPFGEPEEEYYEPGEGAAVPGAEYEEASEEDGPEEEADPNAHHLSCPSCGAGFTAHGPRPLVTECPSCGVRGVLR